MRKTLLFTFLLLQFGAMAQNLSIQELGRYTDGRDGACEISAYDSTFQQLFITNAAIDSLDIVDVSSIGSPIKVGGVDITQYGGGINSVVALPNGNFAIAVEAVVKQDNGKVIFFDHQGNYINAVTVGALPDMITVTPDKSKLLVANEGEPNDDYTVDPEGSVSIIDLSVGIANLSQSDVTSIDFTQAPATIPGGLKKPNTTWAVDLEPEYIAVNENSTTAVVSCQENNVFVFIDLTSNTISSYKGLGFKDHSLPGNGMDASNKDNTINIQNWPVKGVYQPDAIYTYSVGGNTYYLSANEGDARDYAGYSSEVRIKDLTLDATVFPNAADLQDNDSLGRLKTFTADMIGDTDNDGDVDELYCYGARSFSIWDHTGSLIWDSGDQIEQYIAANHANFFNCDDGLASEQDSRSDDNGAEPEAITVGKIGAKFYAFIGLERQGGVMVYDVTTPTAPVFEAFINSFKSNGTMTDIAPEGIIFISENNNPTGQNLLIVSHEVSGTTAIFAIDNVSNIDKVKQDQRVLVFPNPTEDVLTIEMNTAINSYSIVNELGQVLMQGSVNAKQMNLNISELPTGVYVLMIKGENGKILPKKVVKR